MPSDGGYVTEVLGTCPQLRSQARGPCDGIEKLTVVTEESSRTEVEKLELGHHC